MGFFSGLAGGMLGGGSTTGTGSTNSGFTALPASIQQPSIQYANQVNDLFSNPSQYQQMFTPLAQTQSETNALSSINQGLGSQDTFNQNLAMLQNPFDEYVINDINRQSQGANSLVNQAATQAGQQGSNRSFLGSSDVEANRLNQIGMFRQGQYNNAVNQALGPLAGLQQQDITNQLGAGEFQRNLDAAQKQVPFSALQQYGALLGALPQNASQGNQWSGESGNMGNALGNIGNIVSAGASLAGFFSDRRIKTDIEEYGEENGHKLYKFKYDPSLDPTGKEWIGVMAQDVLKTHPHAVYEVETEDGMILGVDYGMINVRFREAA